MKLTPLLTGIKDFDMVLTKIAETEGIKCAMFLLQSLDPWHYSHTPVSCPNRTGEASISYRDKDTFAVTLPVPLTQNPWDLTFQFFEHYYGTTHGLCGRDNDSMLWATGAAFPSGGIVLIPSQNGVANHWTTAAINMKQFLLPQARYNCAKLKINAIVMKIVDTTPELYRGGMAHCADINEGAMNEQSTWNTLNLVAGTIRGSISGQTIMIHPYNISQIDDYPSYQSHACEKGVLTSAVINNDLEPSACNYTHQIYETTFSATDPNTNPVWAPTMGTSSVSALIGRPNQRCHNSGITPKQIYLTGLQPQANLTVTVVVYSECYYSPSTTAQAAFLPLLQEATPWSPKTLAVISRLQRDQKSMMDASANDFSKWLATTMRNALPDLADILQSIPHPVAQAFGLGARGLAEYSKQISPEEKAIVKKEVDKQVRVITLQRMKKPPPVVVSNRGKGVIFGPVRRDEAADMRFLEQRYGPENAFKVRSDAMKKEKKRRKKAKKVAQARGQDGRFARP